MKVIELMEMVKDLDPSTVLTFEKEEKPKPPLKITFDTEIYRVREYIYWLNNRLEELVSLPVIGSLIRLKSKNSGHQYQYDKWFELEVKSHRYQYKDGWNDNPGYWEITVELVVPSAYTNYADWLKMMEEKGYLSTYQNYGQHWRGD